eukprot:TRINITY_DN2885_c0_g1_i1.p1 TRINITY_DN2885_c0_g1~~TRINITY_DN2885_c0_g1_i1.p1  ORF type:complete len:478 (+),score=49.30 TRINITY_DN2885_c0_g1_i1:201-1634(+)
MYLGYLLHEMRNYPEGLEHLISSYQLKCEKTNTVYYIVKCLLACHQEREIMDWAVIGIDLSHKEEMQKRNKSPDPSIEEDLKLLMAQRFELLNIYGNICQKFNEHGKANEALAKAIELKPNRSQLWFSRALSLIELGNTGGALSCFDRSIELNRNHTRALLHKGLLLKKMGYLQEFEGFIDRVLELEPEQITACLYKGRYIMKRFLSDDPTQISQEQFNQAEELLKRVVELCTINPKDNTNIVYKALSTLAKVYNATKRPTEAIETCQKLINHNPSAVMPWELSGTIFQALGLPEEALRRINQGLVLEPNNVTLLCTKSRCLLSLEETELAISAMEKAYRHHPNHPLVRKYRPLVLLYSDRYEEALPMLKQAAIDLAIKQKSANEPPNPQIDHYHTHIGFAKFNLGECERGMSMMDLCIKVDPNYGTGYVNKGVALFKLQKYEEACKFLEKGIELDPLSFRAKNYYTQAQRICFYKN